MCHKSTMELAKKDLSKRVGVSENNLDFVFIWEFAGEIYFSFQINQPGHAHNGSTLSVNVSDLR